MKSNTNYIKFNYIIFMIGSVCLHGLVLLFSNIQVPLLTVEKPVLSSFNVDLVKNELTSEEIINSSVKKNKKTQPNFLKTTKANKSIKSAINSKSNEAAKVGYLEQLKSYVENNQYYPKAALRLKQKGTVSVKLKITDEGTFQAIKISKESDYDLLNTAAVNLIKKLKKFKPLPPELSGSGHTFIIPISYRLGGSY